MKRQVDETQDPDTCESPCRHLYEYLTEFVITATGRPYKRPRLSYSGT